MNHENIGSEKKEIIAKVQFINLSMLCSFADAHEISRLLKTESILLLLRRMYSVSFVGAFSFFNDDSSKKENMRTNTLLRKNNDRFFLAVIEFALLVIYF